VRIAENVTTATLIARANKGLGEVPQQKLLVALDRGRISNQPAVQPTIKKCRNRIVANKLLSLSYFTTKSPSSSAPLLEGEGSNLPPGEGPRVRETARTEITVTIHGKINK
jgi:hypothetical protein